MFQPEVGEIKPRSQAVPVHVYCPECDHENTFWGLLDGDGDVIEHFGRRCQGGRENPLTLKVDPCGFRFRFKVCEECGAENDIAARNCLTCRAVIVDPDKKLQDAMKLKDAHILRPYQMIFEKTRDRKHRERLTVTYTDVDSNPLREFYYYESDSQKKAFYHNFVRRHCRLPGCEMDFSKIDDLIGQESLFRTPQFIIARQYKSYWRISEKIF